MLLTIGDILITTTLGGQQKEIIGDYHIKWDITISARSIQQKKIIVSIGKRTATESEVYYERSI